MIILPRPMLSMLQHVSIYILAIVYVQTIFSLFLKLLYNVFLNSK